MKEAVDPSKVSTVLPSCSASLPKQKQAEGRTAKIKVNPTQLSQKMPLPEWFYTWPNLEWRNHSIWIQVPTSITRQSKSSFCLLYLIDKFSLSSPHLFPWDFKTGWSNRSKILFKSHLLPIHNVVWSGRQKMALLAISLTYHLHFTNMISPSTYNFLRPSASNP